jgi:hypothetical protein
MDGADMGVVRAKKLAVQSTFFSGDLSISTTKGERPGVAGLGHNIFSLHCIA